MTDTPIPITFHVDSIEFEPQPVIQQKQRKSTIDVEIRTDDAKVFLKNLAQHMEHAEPGGIRIRFTGRLHL